MRWSDVTERPSDRTLRSFGALCLLLIGGLASWRWWQGGSEPATFALGTAAVGIGVIGLIHPPAIRWVFTGWLIAVFPLSWLMSQTVLAVMYFGVLTPTAVIARLNGRDLLGLARRDAVSFWRDRRAADAPERYLRQF